MVIVVEHRDRLTGFGYEDLDLAVLLAVCGRRVVVVEDCESTSGLVGEVSGVLTGLCARLYGPRWAAEAVAVVTCGRL